MPPRFPDSAFKVINPLVRWLLRSPFHPLWSSNLMLVTFRGRRSGRMYTTPVRYMRDADTVRCFTARTNQWWRNLQDGAEVILTIAGKPHAYRADVTVDDKPAIRTKLERFLARFPQDSPYYQIRLDSARRPLAADIDRAATVTIMVEARRLPTTGGS